MKGCERMKEEITLTPVRDKPPCMGCTRENKKPGCHDTCQEYHNWKAEIKRVKQAREDYINRTYHKRKGSNYG